MSIKDKFDIKGRVAVITGGAGLLGKEFARTLLEYGGKVVMADIARDRGAAALKEIGQGSKGDIVYEYVDVSSKDSVEKMAQSVKKRFGKVDILINCAALDPKFEAGDMEKHGYAFEDYPLESWERAVSVNLTGAFLCCQVIGRIMISQEKGVIVNVASEIGMIAPDNRIYIKKAEPEKKRFKPIDYPVTKAALIHLSRYLASYWGDKNIRVNTLTPATVYTDQDDELVKNISYRAILGRMSDKNEFCGALIFLVSDASSYMTGANLVVDGGRTAW
ncbi:MAG: SDR family oxidoreductase [Candidatus Omnitrophica bacterium]|nr:SDR family oxidoreductase [Candidatus Omnitrophota bacterium]